MARKECNIGNCENKVQTKELGEMQEMIKEYKDLVVCEPCVLYLTMDNDILDLST